MREHLVGRGQAAGRLQHEDAIGAGVQTCSLRYVPTLSTPALVRVSDRKISPASRRMARQ